jgi:hypothetical protein
MNRINSEIFNSLPPDIQAEIEQRGEPTIISLRNTDEGIMVEFKMPNRNTSMKILLPYTDTD